MELFPNLVNGALIVLVGVLLNYVMRDRFRNQEKTLAAQLSAMQAQMMAMQVQLQAQIDALRLSMDARFESVDRQFASVRSDLTQIALAVGAQPRPQAG